MFGLGTKKICARHYILVSILAMFLTSSFADVVKCQDLRWKLTAKGTPGIYRGYVKAGSVDVIHVEVRNSSRVIGQGMGFPNPGGNWEIYVYGDYNIKKSHREKFYCEKF